MKFTVAVHDRESYRGGPVINMRRLLPRLVERGHEVRVLGFAGSASPTLDWLRDEHNIVVDKWPVQARYTHQRVRWILRKLRSWPPDLFVPNCFVSALYAARWAREAGIPSLGYFRSDDEFYWRMADEFIFGSPEYALSGVACVSQVLLDRLCAAADNRNQVKFCFLPSGVPVAGDVPQKSCQQLNICYIGRLEQKQKRIHETAEALIRNLQNGHCDRIGFFGGGSQELWLRELVGRRELAGRVTIHGAVAPERLAKELEAYHASVLLSDYEGTPGAVMDAMSAGLVPITLRLPDGTSELVIDNVTGLQCDDRDACFDRCCERLRLDPDLVQRLAANARRRILEQYSIDATVERFEVFAEQLVNESQPVRRPIAPWRPHLPPRRPEFAREDRRPNGRRALASAFVADVSDSVQRLFRFTADAVYQ